MLKLHLTCPTDIHLHQFTNSAFVESSLDNCDFVLRGRRLTSQEEMNSVLKRLSHEYRPSGKRVIVLIVSDYVRRYSFRENLILLRVSMKRSRKRPNELVVPYLFECPEEPFLPLEAAERPRIGFCGLPKRREHLLRAFEKSSEVETNFIRRTHFWGGAPQRPDLITDFYENIRSTEFTVCQRGNGNFSMRFYQTLAAGRIPVLVNTDMELPLQSVIPWDQTIIFGKSVRDCVNRVIQCHRDGRTELLQQRCADIFHSYLGRQRYFSHLSRELSDQYLSRQRAA